MKLNKNQMYLFLIGTIILVMLINKSFYLLRTDFTEGEIIKRTSKNTSGTYSQTSTFQIVKFTVNNKAVLFSTTANSKYKIGERVTVAYLKSDITKAKIFSLSGYWIPGFTRGLFVFIILSGVVYAFMRTNHIVIICFKKPFSISIHNKQGQNHTWIHQSESQRDKTPEKQKPRISDKIQR